MHKLLEYFTFILIFLFMEVGILWSLSSRGLSDIVLLSSQVLSLLLFSILLMIIFKEQFRKVLRLPTGKEAFVFSGLFLAGFIPAFFFTESVSVLYSLDLLTSVFRAFAFLFFHVLMVLLVLLLQEIRVKQKYRIANLFALILLFSLLQLAILDLFEVILFLLFSVPLALIYPSVLLKTGNGFIRSYLFTYYSMLVLSFIITGIAVL